MLRGLFALLNMTGVPRLVFRLMLDRRVPLRLKLILPAALVYLALPFDVIPDILPALGRIDDLLVIIGALVIFLGLAPREVVAEHARGGGQGAGDEHAAKPDEQVIEGEYRLVDEDENEEDKRQSKG